MRSRSLSALAGISLVVVALVATSARPVAAEPVVGTDATTQAALDWLLDQQQPDGGFETIGFPLFETPDAIVAIAEAAQTSTTWDTSEANDAVLAVVDESGDTPLDAIEDYLAAELTVNTPDQEGPDSDGELEGGPAAKLIVLVAAPLGLSTTTFDPLGDGDPVNLETALAADPPTQGAITSVAYAVMADALTGTPDTEGRIPLLRSSQQANGAWNFGGDPDGTDDDVDTTGYIVTALIAAGLPTSDATVEGALRFLAALHRDGGAFEFHNSFDGTRTANVNSTAIGTFGVEAAGWDQAEACWRTANNPGSGSRPYVPPATYLASQQVDAPAADAGRFLSPNDSFGVTTQPTSQALQGLFRTWLPLTRGELQPLEPLEAFSDVPDCAYYSRGVSWMAAEGLTTGFTDGTFRPGAGISRQALAAQLFRFSGTTFEGPGTPTFSDVSTSHPFYDEIEWMFAEGLTTGYPDGTFRPSGQVNRQQAAAFLHRIAGEPVPPVGAPSFPDVSAGSPFADAISWMAAHRLTNPYPDGTFRSLVPLNRGQLSTFLFRLASTEPAWDDVALPPTVLF